MLYYNPITKNAHTGKPAKYLNNGKENEELLIHDCPGEIDEYQLINSDIKNSDNTYGEWIKDIEKVRSKALQYIKEKWEESYELPLQTPLGFSMQQHKIDLDLMRDGVLNAVLNLYNNAVIALTDNEAKNLLVGVMIASVFDKIKSYKMTVRDYSNELHEINISDAQVIAMLQANAIATNFQKKWDLQDKIKKATTITEIENFKSQW